MQLVQPYSFQVRYRLPRAEYVPRFSLSIHLLNELVPCTSEAIRSLFRRWVLLIDFFFPIRRHMRTDGIC